MSKIDLYEAMSTLRAVRRLRPDPVPQDVLRRVLQAACWAPTGGNAQPWKIVWIAWQQQGDVIEGRSDTNGLAVLKDPVKKLRVELEREKGKGLAGLIFGFESAKEFYLFQVLSGTRARVVRRTGGRWRVLEIKDRPRVEGRDVLSLKIVDGRVVLSVNGAEFGTYDVKGRVGLNVDSCRVLFRVKAER